MSQWFKPLHTAAKERKILAFDVEGGGGYDGFTCGAIVSDNIYRFYLNREEMYQKLMREMHEGTWCFAHNLQYDLPLLEGPDFPRGDLIFTQHGLLWSSYEYKGQKHKLFDSINLFPRLSVEYLSSLVGVEKVALSEGLLRLLSRGENWEVYSDPEKAQIRQRVLSDAEILFLAVANLQELALSLGGEMRPTIAGISMDIYRRKYHKWPWMTLGPETNKLCRPCYYGGRTENFVFGKVEHVNSYDVNSLYPYAQSIARFPHPNHLSLDFPTRLSGDWLGWEGCAECTLDVPEAFIPVTPLRHERKLFFPVGRLRGLWTLFDVRQSIAAGAVLRDVAWVLGTKVTFNPFTQFCETLFARRMECIRSGSQQANFIKLILNSLYGRWGLNEEGGLYKIENVEHVTDWSKYDGYTTEIINGQLFAFGRIETTRRPDYCNVLFAAQITSVAREVLNQAITSQSEQAVYCDTDSCLTTGRLRTGSGLGDWRIEAEDVTADLLGPKEYALHNSVMGDQYVVKGLPPQVAEQYFREGAARYYRALSVREALNRKMEPTQWIETYKGHGTIIPKRWAVVPTLGESSECYSSEPYRVEELAQLSSPEFRAGQPEAYFHGRAFLSKPRPKPPGPPAIA